MGQPYKRVTLYKSSIERNIDLLVILFFPKFGFLFAHATADGMPANFENVTAIHYIEVYLQVLTITNELVANVIDGNVQLNALSQLPDNFQCVAERV